MGQSNKSINFSKNDIFNSVLGEFFKENYDEYYKDLVPRKPDIVEECQTDDVYVCEDENTENVHVHQDECITKDENLYTSDDIGQTVTEDIAPEVLQPRKITREVYTKRSNVLKTNPTPPSKTVIEEEGRTTTHLHKEDAELVSRLLRAKKIADASGIEISIVLQEMANKSTNPTNSKRQIDFKKDAKGNIIGAEIIN
jgi:hypothetical protein